MRTQVSHAKGDAVMPIGVGRLLAELIPDSVFFEIPGNDHFA